METIDYRTINDASVNDFEKLPYIIKCRGLIFKKEHNWYYSKNHSLDDIAANGDTCEIIEWEEPEEDKKIEKLEITKYPELGENVVGYPVPERIIAKINEIIDKVNGE